MTTLHYRHLKRIARGETDLKPIDAYRLFKNVLVMRYIPADFYKLPADIVLCKHRGVLKWHCITEQECPKFWFLFDYEGIDIGIGYNLIELCEYIIKNEQYIRALGLIEVRHILNCMTFHMRWIARKMGVKAPQNDFYIPRYYDLERVYAKFNQITIKFIKYHGKEFSELRSTRKYKKPRSILV